MPRPDARSACVGMRNVLPSLYVAIVKLVATGSPQQCVSARCNHIARTRQANSPKLQDAAAPCRCIPCEWRSTSACSALCQTPWDLRFSIVPLAPRWCDLFASASTSGLEGLRRLSAISARSQRVLRYMKASVASSALDARSADTRSTTKAGRSEREESDHLTKSGRSGQRC